MRAIAPCRLRDSTLNFVRGIYYFDIVDIALTSYVGLRPRLRGQDPARMSVYEPITWLVENLERLFIWRNAASMNCCGDLHQPTLTI
jgi:hypothetical protein